MKKYKENEDSREQFFEERTKGTKQVIGASTSNSSVTDQFGDMFGGKTGDLAMQRKLEKPILTVERVESELANTVVTPDEPAPKSDTAGSS